MWTSSSLVTIRFCLEKSCPVSNVMSSLFDTSLVLDCDTFPWMNWDTSSLNSSNVGCLAILMVIVVTPSHCYLLPDMMQNCKGKIKSLKDNIAKNDNTCGVAKACLLPPAMLKVASLGGTLHPRVHEEITSGLESGEKTSSLPNEAFCHKVFNLDYRRRALHGYRCTQDNWA